MSLASHENQPILSLFSDAGNTHDLESAQVGYPTLCPADSPQRYQLLSQWLHVCDTEHGHGPEAFLDSGSLEMPTRLIHIGDSNERLEVIQKSSSLRYVALSHCWGNSPKLCTLTSNLETFRKEIPHDLLPLNFQEAIRGTRALKIKYLWIDSLCIVQDDLADWEREAGRMGQVFSNAYCTIAATSAAASDEGFLTRRTDSPLFATMKTPGGGILHVSEFMEDYHQDLELAPLNTRGWVLQERALSRRTLHFTKTQVYWECGEGVRCERLFKLSNPQAAIFADSDFPQSILKQFKGGRITLFQHLYQTYSRLAFSQISDRPVAILGLEKRLLDAFQTRGGFGIFEVYLARSLLWSRQKDVFLSRIPFTKSRPPPSWSWMAYQGPITYMEVPFDQVDWTNDCVFPSDFEITKDAREPALKVLARDLTLTRLDFLHRVKLDQQAEIQASDLRGIVLGKDKHRESREPMNYVLLITLAGDELEGKGVYVRAGVAWLLEHNIASDGEEVEVY
ncbi:hypothetical protein CEP52_007735 [Fusarium oligoseptatum]|uniref:Heterokaryon incompatibility domain-containing protein n=1 Tax=Fusarium oligoseptatum TaxID=2604345 RepID=A0A428TLA0_9HYPO|nr:hypothetical protein CEP52_007735 [Fusarium oligoseptatum]